jgi:hypothetical protein
MRIEGKFELDEALIAVDANLSDFTPPRALHSLPAGPTHKFLNKNYFFVMQTDASTRTSTQSKKKK